MHEVPGVLEDLALPADRQVREHLAWGPCPSPSPPSPRRAPEERHRQAGQLDASSTPGATGRSRPCASTRRSSSASRRRLERARRRRGGATSPSTAAGSSAPAVGPAPRTCPACAACTPCAGGGRASRAPRCRPSGRARARRRRAIGGADGIPSRLMTWVKRYGWASASWIISEPPLLCPSTGPGRPPQIWSITAIASRRSASQPYSAAWSLSPWPRWSQAITRQPAAAIAGRTRRRCGRSPSHRGRRRTAAHRRRPTRGPPGAGRRRRPCARGRAPARPGTHPARSVTLRHHRRRLGASASGPPASPRLPSPPMKRVLVDVGADRRCAAAAVGCGSDDVSARARCRRSPPPRPRRTHAGHDDHARRVLRRRVRRHAEQDRHQARACPRTTCWRSTGSPTPITSRSGQKLKIPARDVRSHRPWRRRQHAPPPRRDASVTECPGAPGTAS